VRKRPPIIAVRPRKGSPLEAEQQTRDNDMADIIHEWATMFSTMTEQESGEGEK
jgi:hypothetical protein